MNNLFVGFELGVHKLAIMCIVVLTLLGVVLFIGAVGAVDLTDYWFCNSIEDFLDSRPYHANTSLIFEPLYLQWGRENGIPECQNEVLPDKRREALYAVYKLIRKKYIPDAVVAYDAPDVGGKNWRNFAMYDSAAEKPGTEVAINLLNGDQVRGPEDGKQRMLPCRRMANTPQTSDTRTVIASIHL